MFLCDCHHCGRRELRGPRSLTTNLDGAFVATCRACGTDLVVAGARPAAPARAPQPVPARTVAPAPANPAPTTNPAPAVLPPAGPRRAA